MTSHRRHLADEQGWALAVAICLMGIMLTIALGAFSFVDSQSRRSVDQRNREQALTLDEGVLYTQGFALARSWPSTVALAFPTSCDSGSVYTGSTAKQCPDRQYLATGSGGTASAAFTSSDFQSTASSNGGWQTWVRDNGGGLANSFDATPAVRDAAQGTCLGPCTWDANGDGILWVQARSLVHGKPRNVAALLRLEKFPVLTPQAGLISGAFKITNNGAGSLDASGTQVLVRCTPDYGNNNSSCTDYGTGQLTGANATTSSPAPGNLMTAAQIDLFRQTAITNGTYFADCPSTIYAAAVFFVENCASSPNYNSSSIVTTPCTVPAGSGLSTNCVNSIATPGVMIVNCGEMHMNAQWTYVGVVYFANGTDGSCTPRGSTPAQCNGPNDPTAVLDSQGGFGVWGAIAADGNACMLFGSNGGQFKFDRNAFGALQSFGTVGLVQNTWRELPPN